jgi:hypothetical protein
MKAKTIAVPIIALGLMASGGAIWAGHQTQAADNSTQTVAESPKKDAPPSDFAEKLAEKLGVDKSKVESALSEIKDEHKAERQAKLSSNLDPAVKDGAITADQKQKILDHMKEMRNKREKNRADDQQWAKDNGIDMSKLKPYLGAGRGKLKSN